MRLEEGLFVQPLPAWLAPADGERPREWDQEPPEAGIPVVIFASAVCWLETFDAARPLRRGNTHVATVPLADPREGQARAAEWQWHGSFDDTTLEDGDEDGYAIWDLLIEHLNTHPTGETAH